MADDGHHEFLLAPPASRGGVCCVGNFDGVHLGHAALAAAARDVAAAVGGPAVAVTFECHPAALLAPERTPPILTTLADRADLLRHAGMDAVAVLRTSRRLLDLDPAAFFRRVIVEGLAARGVVEGFNFRFGRDRAGDNATLRSLCDGAGLAFREVAPAERDGAPVSSSRVRDALAAGDAAAAAALLGRPYRIRGTVSTGAKRGRTIGFPTANLIDVPTLLPADGVYAMRAAVNGTTYAAAANVGPNPTFGESARKVEIHLIDFAGDLYGRPLAADFVARLRPTVKFANVGELVGRMQADVAEARRIAGGGS